MSEKINEENELSEAVNKYLYNYSEYTQYLFNTLSPSQNSLFFEKDHSEKIRYAKRSIRYYRLEEDKCKCIIFLDLLNGKQTASPIT